MEGGDTVGEEVGDEGGHARARGGERSRSGVGRTIRVLKTYGVTEATVYQTTADVALLRFSQYIGLVSI